MNGVKKIVGLFRNKQTRRLILGLILVVVIGVSVFLYYSREGRIYIDDSLITAPLTTITSQIPGPLNELDVSENQTVKKGDALAIVGSEVVRAPTDGLIVQANKQIGSQITPQNQVVQLINPNDFRVVGTIDENKGLKDIQVGQVASFSVDAFPGQTFWGYVDSISDTAKQTQISFSISNARPTQQFAVSVRYDPFKYPQLKNGMSAKLVIFTKTRG